MANETTAFDREGFEEWRAAHPANAKAFDEVAKTWALDLPVEATRYTNLSGRTDSVGRTTHAKRSKTPALALAASLLVGLVAIGMSEINPFSRSDHREDRIASPLVTADGETRSFRLSDGSIATLGPRSELRIAFSGDRRALALVRGVARFEVAHEPSRNFEVTAGNSVVTARGTIFAVRMTSQGIRVALYRGAIDVEQIKAGRRTGEVRRLAPGDVIALPSAMPPEADASPGKAASGGEIATFDKTPVSEAVAAFEARTGVRFVIDAELRAETITGGFDANDAAGFADMLAAMFDLVVTRGAGDELVLTARR